MIYNYKNIILLLILIIVIIYNLNNVSNIKENFFGLDDNPGTLNINFDLQNKHLEQNLKDKLLKINKENCDLLNKISKLSELAEKNKKQKQSAENKKVINEYLKISNEQLGNFKPIIKNLTKDMKNFTMQPPLDNSGVYNFRLLEPGYGGYYPA